MGANVRAAHLLAPATAREGSPTTVVADPAPSDSPARRAGGAPDAVGGYRRAIEAHSQAA
ncbi:hypothetical protein [Streptomyces sp. enrichment culture]|uniref:hypothetical protein n=1 Tax=Streptomyces sp. enrichment culture TaxID=1795815 RepID=UPI003F57F35C